MMPIGKGSRFLVLTGPLIGQEGVVKEKSPRTGAWVVMFDDGKTFYHTTATLEGPTFKRLADLPAEIDPLFAELAALEEKRARLWGGAAEDDRKCPSEWVHFVTEEAERADEQVGAVDGGGDSEYRDAMMQAATFCLAAVRCIDRAHKR